MDAFAGLDGLSASSTKKISLEEQRKQKQTQSLQFSQDLDWLSTAKPTSVVATPSFGPSITPQRTASASPKVFEEPKISSDSASLEDDDVFGLFSPAPPKKAVSLPPTSTKTGANASSPSYSTKSSYSTGSTTNNETRRNGTPSSAKNRDFSPNGPVSGAFKYDLQLAELTEMGFEPADGQRALNAMNGSVNGSVNWLMAEAQGLPLPAPRSSRSKQLANADLADLSAQASQFTSSVFSKASNLFSKGRKELEKAYSQYQHSSPANEPAWMRDKAKHDARRVSPAPDLPVRPRSTKNQENLVSPQETPKIPSPQEPPKTQSAPKSRAELFRQRQMQRNTRSDSNATPHSEFKSPNEFKSPSEPKSPTESNSIESSPSIDLLNLHTSLPDTALSATSRDIYATSRELGTACFRNGDFENAVVHYTTAIQALPPKHSLRTILLANRAAASMKAGNLQLAFDDTQAGIDALPTYGRQQRAEDGTNMADIWVKLVTRHAQAAEHMEKFPAALAAWELLLNHGYASPATLAAKRRCLAALDPEKVEKASEDRSKNQKKPLRRGWGTTGAVPSSKAGKEALEKVKQQHTQQAAEERERDKLRDEISARVDAWKRGNERDLRTLLATLPSVLWDDCDWAPVTPAELVVPRKVRIVYMKAVARTHPDKVPASAPVATKMIAQSVFVALQTAWDVFRTENNL